jgi:hypothetical protein
MFEYCPAFQGGSMKAITRVIVVFLAAAATFAQAPAQQAPAQQAPAQQAPAQQAPAQQAPAQKEAPPVSIVGYVRDSGCVHRYREFIKPAPNGCAEECVRAGSPIVILTKKAEVYHPISAEIPDVDVRQKLLPFVGKLVKVTGHVYGRGGSSAISLEQIEEIKE